MEVSPEDAAALKELRVGLTVAKDTKKILQQIEQIEAKYRPKSTIFVPQAVSAAQKKSKAAAAATPRQRKIRQRAAQKRKAPASKTEVIIPRNIIHIVLRDGKWKAMPHRIGKDQPLPISVAIAPPLPGDEGSAGAGAGVATPFTITDGPGGAAAPAQTDIALDAQQKAIFVKTAPPANDLFEVRMAALALPPQIEALQGADRSTLWSRLVLIAGFDPYVALRIVCDGAHDYGSLINGFYTRFLIETVFTSLAARAPASGRPLIDVGGILDRVLTPQSDKGGGFNAKPEAIARELEDLHPLEGVAGAEHRQLEECLVGSGMRAGPEGADCVSVCALACSFGSTGKLPDSITFNLLPHYVEAANKQSVRALWAQSLPQFMDAAGTPTEDAVSLYGAKFVDLTKATLNSGAFDCNVAPFREFSADGDSFTVYNFYGNSKHIFRRDVPIPAGEHRTKVGAAGCSLEIFYEGAPVATIYAKQSISLNGLSSEVTKEIGRGKSKKTKDPISISYVNNPPTPSDKAQAMMAKQLLDWAQAYFIAFLWHNFGLIFTLITNDTFLLRVAKWLRVPFVLLMSKTGAKLYCFDSRAMVLDGNDKQAILDNIAMFTDAKSAELFVEIDGHIQRIFTHDQNGTAVPIIGCLFSRVLELKRKIRETVGVLIADRDRVAVGGADTDAIAQKFRYLTKQDAYVYLISKFKDDIETLFASAISINRSINSLIAAYTKQEPAITLTETLSSIINTMKTFLPPEESTTRIALWLTKIPFPIVVSRADLQKNLLAALIARAVGKEAEGRILAELTRSANIPFTADTIYRTVPGVDAAAPVEALAIANKFREFTAIDWSLSTPGEPLYPYYYLFSEAEFAQTTVPHLPLEMVPKEYSDAYLTAKQQERVRSLGYDAASFNALQKPARFLSSDPPQKILKRLSDIITAIGIPAAVPTTAKGGRRRDRQFQQRGGARNGSYSSLTVWDKINFEYGGLFNRTLENHSLAEAAAAAVDPMLTSTIEIRSSSTPLSISEYFYKLEAYLCYCIDFIENNAILIADYVTMLAALSELRIKCFAGDITDRDILIELACILLIEDDDYPSVFSTIHNNHEFDRRFMFENLRLLLDSARTAEKDEISDLAEIFIDIFPGAAAAAGAAAAPPTLMPPEGITFEEIFEESYKVFNRNYDATATTVDHMLYLKAAAAAAPPVAAAGGAGGSADEELPPLTPAEETQKELDRVLKLIGQLNQALDNEKSRQRVIMETPPPKAGLPLPTTNVEKAIKQLEQEIAGLEIKRISLLKAVEAAAIRKGPAKGSRRGGFRRTRSRIGKKRATRKVTASSKGRKTRRRK